MHIHENMHILFLVVQCGCCTPTSETVIAVSEARALWSFLFLFGNVAPSCSSPLYLSFLFEPDIVKFVVMQLLQSCSSPPYLSFQFEPGFVKFVVM